MKESLVGLTTIAILFGLVWLSQGDIYTAKNNIEKYENYKEKEVENEVVEVVDELPISEEEVQDIYVEEKTTAEYIDPCGICKNINDVDINANYNEAYTNMYDNFTFSEAFKLCRQCQGNDGIFYWKDNLYLTKIKQKEINVVEKEITEPKTPPTKTHETVNSK